METLTVGCKAYVDTFDGLIPCKVEAISGHSGTASSAHTITVRLTATRKAWRKGEVIQRSALSIVPRKAVHIRSGQYRIWAYSVTV